MRAIVLLLITTLLVSSCQTGPTLPQGSPSPDVTASGGASPSIDAIPTVDPAAFHPLPPDLTQAPGPRDPSASITATSSADAQPGLVVPIELGHCGLGSPFDFDGNLWDAVAGRDARGGPIDTSDEIGEFINPTSGEVLLLGSGQVQFRTPGGSIVLLTRHVGAKSYFLCG